MLFGAGALGAVIALALLALAVLWFIQRGTALPNTYVADVAVGGMDADEMRAALRPLADEREDTEVTFAFEDEDHVLAATDVGYRVDLDATIAAAMRRGRTGLPGDVVTRLRAFRTSSHHDLRRDLDDAELRAWVDALADDLDRVEIRGDVTIDSDDLAVDVDHSQGAVQVDRDAVDAFAREAILHRGEDTTDLPAETTEQPIDNDELDALAAQLSHLVEEPFALRHGDDTLTLQPTDLAELIEVEEVEGGRTGLTLELVVTTERVEEVAGEVARGRFDVDPVDAGYSANRTPPTTFDAQSTATFRPVSASVDIVAGSAGQRFDPERAAEQLTEVFREGSRAVEVDLERVEAEFSNEDAEDRRPTHALGTFTTYYQAGADRNQNIQRLADVIDGALVQPGEQFSINAISGERTCEKGYVPAGTIIQGELVDTCGGGTSQFGTTTFNAAFFAGVQLDQWRAHSWYISRYPMGREATLSYPVLDVVFTNDTEGAIVVKTDHTSTSITVTLYGQPIAESVTAEHGEPTDHKEHDEEIRRDSSLPAGAENVVQSGGDGFKVRVVRTVNLIGGGERTRVINTTYQPQTRIVERGPEPASSSSTDAEDDEEEDDDG